MDRWQDWAGQDIGKPNVYVNQLLKNLGDRTGHMPFLRVGANSEDRASVNLSVKVMNATFPAPTENVPNPEADHIFLGRDFYALSGNLPRGTPFMWGLSLKQLNKSQTVQQARLLAETFQGKRAALTRNVKLVNVEIGNEPDFYGDTGYSVQGPLGRAWDVANYSSTWPVFARAVSQEIAFGSGHDGKPQLSVGAFTGFQAPAWTPEAAYAAGVLDDDRLRAKTVQYAAHAYSGGFDPRRVVRPGELMDKLSIRANMSVRVGGVKASRAMGLNYILGETNSYANHGQPGLSNTVESALWMIDWVLLAASRGVERVHLHHGRGFRYNTLQPIDESDDGLNITHPHILPSYHALLIVNEAIGTSGNSYVAEIPTMNNSFTAYGVWEKHQLKRAVVLNTMVYLGTGEKPVATIKLDNLKSSEGVRLKRLESHATTSYSGVTWAGQSFETLSGVPTGDVTDEVVQNGEFELPASSAVLLSFGHGRRSGHGSSGHRLE